MNPLQPEIHPLAPFLPPNARLLLLGSFPPPRKRWSMDFFYPNYTNDMWRIFGLIFFDDKNHFVDIEKKKFRKDNIEQFLREKAIAVSDTVAVANRLNGNASDLTLEVVEPLNLAGILESNSSLSYSGDHRTKGNRHITFYHRFTSSCNRRVRRFSLP